MKKIESADQEDLSNALESYFDETDYIVDKFRKHFGLDKKASGYYTGYDQVAEDFVQKIIDSGDFKELLEYLVKNNQSSVCEKLLDKYFPETPEGTYSISIPEIRDSRISPNPEKTLDPTIHESEYIQILNALQISGHHIEKTITSYLGQDEERLRGVILGNLQTAFPSYSASGETFNVDGKTDILLKHKSENIFVAECKIWSDEPKLLDAIDQLMGYLTYRDTKTALILFIQNSSFSSILTKVPKIISSHKYHKKDLDSQNDNQFNYEFIQKNDPSKFFKLSVICFNFYHKSRSKPKSKQKKK